MAEIIFLSLFVNISSTILASFIGVLLGVLISVYNFRWKNFLCILFNVLMGLPPVVVGLTLYIILSRQGILGVLDLLYSREAMVMAQVLLVTPIIVALTIRSMEEIWREYRDLVFLVGKNSWISGLGLFLDHPRIVATVIMSGFGRAVAEVGAIMIVGGNIEGYTRMVTGAIVLETNKGKLDEAIILGLALLCLSLIVNVVMWFLSGNVLRGENNVSHSNIGT